jgi:group I intron endonuclease
MNIYKFTHIESGRSYIGQTIQDPNRRRLEHIAASRHSPKSYHFHNAINKYGIEAFTFEVISQASSIDELNLLEAKFIEEFDSINNGFNIRSGGGNKTHNADSLARMSEAQKAAHARRSAEGKDGGWTRADGGGMQGKKHSNEAKQKMSKAAKGRIITADALTKMSAAKKNRTWKIVDGHRKWFDKEGA